MSVTSKQFLFQSFKVIARFKVGLKRLKLFNVIRSWYVIQNDSTLIQREINVIQIWRRGITRYWNSVKSYFNRNWKWFKAKRGITTYSNLFKMIQNWLREKSIWFKLILKWWRESKLKLNLKKWFNRNWKWIIAKRGISRNWNLNKSDSEPKGESIVIQT